MIEMFILKFELKIGLLLEFNIKIRLKIALFGTKVPVIDSKGFRYATKRESEKGIEN